MGSEEKIADPDDDEAEEEEYEEEYEEEDDDEHEVEREGTAQVDQMQKPCTGENQIISPAIDLVTADTAAKTSGQESREVAE